MTAFAFPLDRFDPDLALALSVNNPTPL